MPLELRLIKHMSHGNIGSQAMSVTRWYKQHPCKECYVLSEKTFDIKPSLR